MHQRRQKSLLKHLDFIILDLVFVEISFILGCMLRFGSDWIGELFSGLGQAASYRDMMVMIAMMHFLVILFATPYSNIVKRHFGEECRNSIHYCTYILVGLVFILFVRKSSEDYSRLAVGLFYGVSLCMVTAYRHVYKQYLKRRINRAGHQKCLLLVAPAHKVASVIRDFQRTEVSTVRIVGIILTDDMADMEAAATEQSETDIIHLEDRKDGGMEFSGKNEIRGIPVVGNLETMYEYARSNVVDEVLLYMDGEAASEVASTFITMGIVVHVSIKNLVQMSNATVNRLNGIPVITGSINNVLPKQVLLKRLIDICFGLAGSIVTVILAVLIAPAMMIADPGPLFFRQERVGKNGRIFRIWKFRTMYQDAEERKKDLMAQNKMSGLMFKMDDDPRIIGYGKKFSLGKFLRESSLDEMPQFFNILAGSMSLVGTRPPTVQEYRQYELKHAGRLAMKPGLTGMWQVSGRSNITDFDEVVRLDKQYIENFSLTLDLEIILKTFKVVLGREGSV